MVTAALSGRGLFYDGCHFSEAGAERVADVVAAFLLREVYPADGAG